MRDASRDSYVQRYDASVHPSGARIDFAGFVSLRPTRAPGRGMAVTGHRTTNQHMTALVDADGQTLWLKEASGGLGVSQPAVTGSGDIVMSASDPATFLRSFDPDGHELWTRSSPADIQNIFFGRTYFGIEADVEDNLPPLGPRPHSGAETPRARGRNVPPNAGTISRASGARRPRLRARGCVRSGREVR